MIKKIEKKSFQWERFYDLNPHEIGNKTYIVSFQQYCFSQKCFETHSKKEEFIQKVVCLQSLHLKWM